MARFQSEDITDGGIKAYPDLHLETTTSRS